MRPAPGAGPGPGSSAAGRSPSAAWRSPSPSPSPPPSLADAHPDTHSNSNSHEPRGSHSRSYSHTFSPAVASPWSASGGGGHSPLPHPSPLGGWEGDATASDRDRDRDRDRVGDGFGLDSALAHRSVTIHSVATEDGSGEAAWSLAAAPSSSSFLSALRGERSAASASGSGLTAAAAAAAASRLSGKARKRGHRKHPSTDSPPKPISVRIRTATAHLLRSRFVLVGGVVLFALIVLTILSSRWEASDAPSQLRWTPALGAGVASLQALFRGAGDPQTVHIRDEPFVSGSVGESLFSRVRVRVRVATNVSVGVDAGTPPLLQLAPIRHVCWIFDGARLDYALQSIRSFMHSHSGDHVVVHLVTPVSLRPALRVEMAALAARLPESTFEVSSYDYSLCTRYVRWLKSFSSPAIHVAAHCKLFLAAILDPAVDTVLFLDNDITTVQAAPQCFGASAERSDHYWQDDAHMIGMSVDMGDACQMFPGRCWPVGAGWLVNTPSYATPRCAAAPTEADLSSEFPRQCAQPGEVEAYQFNGGVVLLHLRRMRERHFIRKLIDVTVATARQVHLRPAAWGEQCFINNFFRFYPSALRVLPCGCNYQFTAVRRSIHCPRSPIFFAHGWNTGVSQRGSDPFNRLFYYYREAFMSRNQSRPSVPTISPTPKPTAATATATATASSAALALPVPAPGQAQVAPAPSFFFMGQKRVVHVQQEYYASIEHAPAHSSPPVTSHYGDGVSILTRTAGRARFFEECRASVLEQDYPDVRHLIVTDMPESKETYLAGIADAELIPSLYHQFDPNSVCDCGRTSDEIASAAAAVAASGPGGAGKRECARAPPPSQAAARQSFFDCFCNTSYPMNSYMQSLHRRVTDGWVLYLDDDNLLTSPSSISHAMAHVESEDDLILWRSMLGRVTPSDENFGKRLVHGDVDTAMFLFHSKHINATAWDMFRCGDYRTLASLSKKLRPVWVDHLLTSTNPLRPQLGGLGARGDASSGAPITIIYTGRDTGLRARWLARSIRAYGSPAFDALIHEILLVWNNPSESPPSDLVHASSKLRILYQSTNSLNHRWIRTLDDIRTGVVLNMDDDVFVDKPGVLCLLGWHETNTKRMVAPIVRRIEQTGEYVMSELRRSEPYSVVLPRAVMLTPEHLRAYASMPSELHEYVDTQSAHCDDILLNGAVAARVTRLPPLRVLLPPGSMVDYFESCRAKHREALGGLAFQPARTQRRSECTRWLLERLRANGTQWALTTTSRTIGTCAPRGNRLIKVEGSVKPHQFLNMRAADAQCN